MRNNTHECEAQQDYPPYGNSVTVGRVLYHYSSRSTVAPVGPCIMWMSDGSVIASSYAYKADYYAPVMLIEFV